MANDNSKKVLYKPFVSFNILSYNKWLMIIVKKYYIRRL